MPELRQLRAFVAVAEELNFTRAAARLHLAQQAVSKTVKGLERELGVRLLERTTREVRLTAAGRELLAGGREVLAAADAAFERTRSVGLGRRGRVRLGMSPAVGPDVEREALRALRAAQPEVSVAVERTGPSGLVRGLVEGTLDVALAVTLPPAEGVEAADLRPTPAVLAVPGAHPLARRERVPLRDLDGMRLLTWSRRGTPYTDLLLRRLAAAGARVELVESGLVGAGSLLELTASDAVALVPRGRAPEPDVCFVEIADPFELPLLVLWAAGAAPPAAHVLRGALAPSAGESGRMPA